jgi:hypothetical protein
VDGHIRVARAVGLDVGLVPCQPEIGEGGIDGAVGEQVGVLDGEEVEVEIGFEVAEDDLQRVVEGRSRDRV